MPNFDNQDYTEFYGDDRPIPQEGVMSNLTQLQEFMLRTSLATVKLERDAYGHACVNLWTAIEVILANLSAALPAEVRDAVIRHVNDANEEVALYVGSHPWQLLDPEAGAFPPVPQAAPPSYGPEVMRPSPPPMPNRPPVDYDPNKLDSDLWGDLN